MSNTKQCDREASRVRWISVEDGLPDDGEEVLILTDEAQIYAPSGTSGCMHCAKFIKGRTAAEVSATKTTGFADEFGNNLRPFRWRGDGPCSWFGQDVTHWARIASPFNGE